MPRLLFGCMIAGLVLIAGGCSKVKENLKPAELTEFEATAKFKKVWRKELSQGQDSRYARLTPLLHESLLYVVDVEGHLYAVDALTGKTEWTVKLKTDIGGGVGYAKDTLLVGTLKGEVIALNIADGSEKWRTELSSEVLSSPSGNDEVVVTKTIDGRVFALNLSDGSIRWSYDHPVPVLSLRAQASPVVQEQNAYVAFDNGQIMAFNASTGQLRWSARVAQPKGKTEIERLVDVDSTPVVSGPFVYGAGYQGRIVAINRGTGRINWAQDNSTYLQIVEYDGKIVVVDHESHIKAFDASTGTLAWESDKLHRRSVSVPGVLFNRVVVTDYEGFIHALDLNTGEFVARSDIQSAPVYAQPITFDNKIYMLDKSGKLSVYQFSDSPKPEGEEESSNKQPTRGRLGTYKR